MKVFGPHPSVLWVIRAGWSERSLCCSLRAFRTCSSEWGTWKLSGTAAQWQMQCLLCSRTQTHTHSLSLTDKHTHPLSNFPCVSAVSSLQCNSHCPTHPHPPPYNRISIACLAAVCKRVCVWTSACLTEAPQGRCHGNLSKGSSSSAVTEHRSQGSHEEGDHRGGQEGVGECCSVWCTRGR